MTKADERRLDRIESWLTPKQAFLLWLAEAHEYGSLEGYVLSMRGQPIEDHPYRRLPKQVEQAVRERCKAEDRLNPPQLTAAKTRREGQIWAEVKKAVREVSFFLELHAALTGRIAAEWKAMALQVLLALDMNRDLMLDKEPTRKDIDQARRWIVQSAGDLLMAQRMARRLAEKYTDGHSLLFPEQERHITESIETARWLIESFNDHMEWLAFLRDEEKRPKGKKKPSLQAAPLDLTLIDVDELHAQVERGATTAAAQLVYMAKSEAAMFVGQRELATELLDRVWDAVE